MKLKSKSLPIGQCHMQNAWQGTTGKISPQCVLGVLCLVLFLSVGMLFSNISIWELNCYKCEGSQVITIFEGKMYGRILFTLSSSLINAYYWRLWCKKGIYGQFYILDITFRGQMFGNKTFSYILLFKTWTSIHHLVKKTMISFSKAVKYFCFKLRYGQYKTRVSRQRWLDQCHQINEDLDFHKHHLLALSTYVQKCRLTRFNALYE